MTQFMIESTATDHAGRNVPGVIGPFPTRDQAEAFAHSIIRSGSLIIRPLTAPAVARALAAEPGEDGAAPLQPARAPRMIGFASDFTNDPEHTERLAASRNYRAEFERGGPHRDGPEHVIIGESQEGKTTLAMQWLLDAPEHKPRVLIVHDAKTADTIRAHLHLKHDDDRIITYRTLITRGARRGVEYGIDETVRILTDLLDLDDSPHLLTIVTAAPWQTGTTDQPICPECREGKHRNCNGTAWSYVKDMQTRCYCGHGVVDATEIAIS